MAALAQLERKIEVYKQQYAQAQEVHREQYAQAQRQIEQLQKDKDTLDKQLKNRQEKAERSEKESEKNRVNSQLFTKLVQNNLSPTDTNAALKEQLDGYIREIERCIAYLSSLS